MAESMRFQQQQVRSLGDIVHAHHAESQKDRVEAEERVRQSATGRGDDREGSDVNSMDVDNDERPRVVRRGKARRYRGVDKHPLRTTFLVSHYYIYPNPTTC